MRDCGTHWDGDADEIHICNRGHGHAGRHRCVCGSWRNPAVKEAE